MTIFFYIDAMKIILYLTTKTPLSNSTSAVNSQSVVFLFEISIFNVLKGEGCLTSVSAVRIFIVRATV